MAFDIKNYVSRGVELGNRRDHAARELHRARETGRGLSECLQAYQRAILDYADAVTRPLKSDVIER